MALHLVTYSLPPLATLCNIVVGNHAPTKIIDLFKKKVCLNSKDYRNGLLSYAFCYLGPHSIGYFAGMTLTGVKLPTIALAAAVAITVFGLVQIHYHGFESSQKQRLLRTMLVIAGLSCFHGFFWGSSMNVFVKGSLIRTRKIVTYLDLGPKIYKGVDQLADLFKAVVIACRVLPTCYSLKMTHNEGICILCSGW